MSNEIVVGLDDSPASKLALQWAAQLAKSTDAVLRAVHVLDRPTGPAPPGSRQQASPMELTPEGPRSWPYPRAYTCRPCRARRCDGNARNCRTTGRDAFTRSRRPVLGGAGSSGSGHVAGSHDGSPVRWSWLPVAGKPGNVGKRQPVVAALDGETSVESA
jgi:hypothetical protein